MDSNQLLFNDTDHQVQFVMGCSLGAKRAMYDCFVVRVMTDEQSIVQETGSVDVHDVVFGI